MTAKISLIALGASLLAAASPALAQTTTTTQLASLLAAGVANSPVAFCCNSYDNANSVGQGCSPVVVTLSAPWCQNFYFECAGGNFLCGPASLVDPTATATASLRGPVLPDCQCGTFVALPPTSD